MLAAATAAAGREKQERAAPAGELTLAVRDALAVQYRDAGLPLPPADAPLLLTPSGATEDLPGGHRCDLYAVVFLAEAAQVVVDGVPGKRLLGLYELHSRASARSGWATWRRG